MYIISSIFYIYLPSNVFVGWFHAHDLCTCVLKGTLLDLVDFVSCSFYSVLSLLYVRTHDVYVYRAREIKVPSRYKHFQLLLAS